MKSRFLFPNNYKLIGWLLIMSSLALSVAIQFLEFEWKVLDAPWILKIKNYEWSDGNLTDELACIGLILGLIFLSFSKEKIEDEQIAVVRLESLQWSLYFNYAVLLLAILFVHGSLFLTVMAYNMFTLLIFFLVRFHYILYRQSKSGLSK